MHPLAHLEKQLKDHRRKKTNYYLANILGFVLLLFVSIIFAPLLHEFLHMFFLDAKHKPYIAQLNFDWVNGISGRINPFAELGVSDSVILLGLGILANLVLGALFFLGSWRIKNHGRVPESIFSTYLAVGFIYNPMIYFFASEGDLVNILVLLELQDFAFLLPVTGFTVMLLVSLYIHDHAKHVFSEYYHIQEEIERLEDFLGKQIRLTVSCD